MRKYGIIAIIITIIITIKTAIESFEMLDTHSENPVIFLSPQYKLYCITAATYHLEVFYPSSISLDKMKDHYYCNNISPGCKEACFSDFQELLI